MGCKTVTQSPVIFQDDFEQGSLDLSRWEITRDGDFAKAVVDVNDVDPGEGVDNRLRFLANTIGTSDPLKFLGVTSKDKIDFDARKDVMFDLDWNNQANGCYLTASFYLCPTVSNNPKKESDWLKFEYIGVPPGRNVRINIREKVEGIVHQLYTAMGSYDDKGRPLGLPLGFDSHTISIILDKDNLQVIQDGEELYPASEHNLSFTTAYIYFQMSSGTNYPSREVYFDNVIVNSGVSGRE